VCTPRPLSLEYHFYLKEWLTGKLQFLRLRHFEDIFLKVSLLSKEIKLWTAFAAKVKEWGLSSRNQSFGNVCLLSCAQGLSFQTLLIRLVVTSMTVVSSYWNMAICRKMSLHKPVISKGPMPFWYYRVMHRQGHHSELWRVHWKWFVIHSEANL
jgi:hypothetical protein